MKLLKVAFAAVFALAFGNAYAFHSGGVAECEGCHSMHNSFENAANVTGMAQFTSGPFLLKAQDQSGACLNCHNAADVTFGKNGYHISTNGTFGVGTTLAPVEYTPGGDFAWLKMTHTGKIRGTPTTWEGDRHGHNIIAVDFGYTADKIQAAAPGGTYSAANLACSSCHDPHGRYRRDAAGAQATTGLPIFGSGSYGASTATQGGPAYPAAGLSAAGVYRILGGVGYAPKSYSSVPFVNAAPDAVAPSTYQIVGGETSNSDPLKQVVVAYGQGMSEWCGNCHGKMVENSYTSGMKGLVHPAGNAAHLTAPIVANYNSYVSSGVLTNVGASFSSLAPFEIGSNDYVALKAFTTAPTPAATTNNVACVSCHRAHASGFESMTRYYLGNEFMTISDSASLALYDSSTTENKINTGYSVAQQTAAYNGRPATVFGPYARNYCNKCHAKD
jgi:cytochrome c553